MVKRCERRFTVNKHVIALACGVLLCGCQSRAPQQSQPAPAPVAPVAAAPAPAALETADPGLEVAKFREEADGLKNKIGGRNVVVYFEKPNCQACASMQPIVARAAQNNGISMMRIVPNREEIISFGIGNYPTTVLFMGGTERQRWLGAYHEERFAREFDKFAR